MMPDTPPSVGLPEVEGTHSEAGDQSHGEDFKAFVREHVFRNRYIWILSAANFFVYTIRYAVFDWGATMLMEAKHIKIMHAAGMISGFEAFGFMGAMLGGWLSDRYLGGRTARTCVVYMALAGVSVFLFWKIHTQSELVITGLLCATGFFVYGPQCLLAIACANLATKRAAATALPASLDTPAPFYQAGEWDTWFITTAGMRVCFFWSPAPPSAPSSSSWCGPPKRTATKPLLPNKPARSRDPDGCDSFPKICATLSFTPGTLADRVGSDAIFWQ